MRPQFYLDYGVRVWMSTLDGVVGRGRLALHLSSSAAAPSLGDPEQLWLLTGYRQARNRGEAGGFCEV